MATIDELVLKSESSDHFIRQFMGSLVHTSKASNEIPGGDEFEYLSSFKSFSKLSAETSADLGNVLKAMMDYVEPSSSVELPDDLTDPSLYENVVDMIDLLLQRADQKLDEGAGKSKGKFTTHSQSTDKNRIMQSNVLDIPKPQLMFLSEIDNSRERPFRPRLKKKPCALVPLNLTQKPVDSQDADVIGPSMFFPHPYESELKKLLVYPSYQLADPTKSTPWMPSPEQPLEFIDDEDRLQGMVDELQAVKEIAVDLENHSYRSFQGLACLMQVSSRHKDYVIDVLALRSKMHLMNAVLADPGIVKVFHGCDSDILWLQRDFGCYVVNCFDTYFAAKILKYPALSLSHLVKFHCGVSMNKKHQLSDWRVRPLPQDMIDYAKDDTHYLLYVYDCLRVSMWKSLGDKAHESVLDSSRKICLKRYEKEPFMPLGYRKLRKVDKFSDIQDTVTGALWEWRDASARRLDESTDYIMTSSEMVRLGSMLPRTQSQAEESGPLSAFVREHIDEVLGVISAHLEIVPTPTQLPISETGSRQSKVGLRDVKDITSQESSQTLEENEPDTSGRALALTGAERPDGMESIYTFTAIVEESPIKFKKDAKNSSAASIKSTYEMAGWDAPGHAPGAAMRNRRTEAQTLKEAFRDHAVNVRKSSHAKLETARLSIEKMCSHSSFERDTASHQAPSAALVQDSIASSTMEIDDGTDVPAAREQITSLEIGTGDNRVFVDVPAAMEDMYHISNRNRKRKNEKKRTREAVDEHGDDDQLSATDAGEKEDSHVEGQNRLHGGYESFGRTSDIDSRPRDSTSMEAHAAGRGVSRDSVGSKGKAGQTGAEYDYSRVPQAAALAMSAMGDTETTSQGQRAGKGPDRGQGQGQARQGSKKKSDKKAGSSYNPYLAAGGTRGNHGSSRQSASGRGSNSR